MADAVFYDPANGQIVATVSSSLEVIKNDGRPFVQEPEYRLNWDATHQVFDGDFVEIEGAEFCLYLV